MRISFLKPCYYPDIRAAWQFLESSEKRTRVSVLLNTSFNEYAPIVHGSPEPLDCLLRTRMDVMVTGYHIIEKS